MSIECSAFFKRLAMMIAEKQDERFSDVSAYIRTKISFSLIRMAILCIRGCRLTRNEQLERIEQVDVAAEVDEARLKKDEF